MADKKDETKPDLHNWFSLAVSLAAFMVSVLSYKIARTTQEQSNTPRLVTTDMQLRAAGLGASGDQKTDVPVVTFRIQNLGTLTLKTVMTKVGSNIREQGDMSGTDAKPENWEWLEVNGYGGVRLVPGEGADSTIAVPESKYSVLRTCCQTLRIRAATEAENVKGTKTQVCSEFRYVPVSDRFAREKDCPLE